MLGPNLQQTNLVFEYILSQELEVKDFEWIQLMSTYRPGKTVTSLVHTSSGHSFLFDYSRNIPPRPQYVVNFSPGEHSSSDTYFCETFEEQLDHIFQWIRLLRRDLETPDLWAEAKKQKELLLQGTSPDIENTPFTETESDYISKKLDEATEQLADIKGIPEEIKETIRRESNT